MDVHSLPALNAFLNATCAVLLVIGLAGRFSALGLFVVNVVAVISLSEIAPAAMQAHILWGALLAALAICGLGPWTVDKFLKR